VRYTVNDNFFTFWFRFIYKYSHMVEVGAYEQLKGTLARDYPTFSGLMLERYFQTRLVEKKSFSRIGGYWIERAKTRLTW